MTLKRRQFTREFKLQVLQEADSGKSISQLAREHQVHPTLIHRWRQQLRHQGDRAFPGNGRAVSDEGQDRSPGTQGRSTDHGERSVKKVLSRLEEIPRSARGNGGSS